MIFYPAIDLRAGRVVRLEQGRADRETVYFADATVPASAWKQAGATWLHVVDLDGAFSGHPHSGNRKALRDLLALGLQVQLGGGLREAGVVGETLALGVQRVVLGTKAAQEPEFVRQMLAIHGPEKIAVGLDARDGRVAVQGWVETSTRTTVELARLMEHLGVRYLIHTDISRDGALTGPNFAAQENLLQACGCSIIASGGVSCLADLEKFAQMAQRYPHLQGVIAGKALYEGRLDVPSALKVMPPP